jgi:hypothetical protein
VTTSVLLVQLALLVLIIRFVVLVLLVLLVPLILQIPQVLLVLLVPLVLLGASGVEVVLMNFHFRPGGVWPLADANHVTDLLISLGTSMYTPTPTPTCVTT